MRFAITGGTGFIGRHLARSLVAGGHDVTLVARGVDDRDAEVRRLPRARLVTADLGSADVLADAFAGCDGVAHLAGINREIGAQTYERVHVAGTHNVVAAARRAGVRRIALMSFLRARPHCGSGYHESKWAAEEIVRASGLEFTVLKAGMVHGRGDHMLDHLSHLVHTLPVVPTVGFRRRLVRPAAIDDVVAILRAALVDGRLSRETVAVTGPESLSLADAVRRVASVLGRRVIVFPAPVAFHRVVAAVAEATMKVPVVAKAQVRMLAEGFTEPGPLASPLPDDLVPRTPFTPDVIARGLPAPGPFRWSDLRCAT